MIETLAESFVHSRYRWLIVTAVTLVIALATVLPQVDDYLAIRSERADLREQLAQASQAPNLLAEYESVASLKETTLGKLRDREIDESQVAELRTWLVNSAREAGCRVRRIDLGSARNRPWAIEDSPLVENRDPLPKDQQTPFDLQARTVTLSITGSNDEVRTLLKTIDADQRLKHTQLLDLRPGRRGHNELQLDLSLRYFALVKPKRVG